MSHDQLASLSKRTCFGQAWLFTSIIVKSVFRIADVDNAGRGQVPITCPNRSGAQYVAQRYLLIAIAVVAGRMYGQDAPRSSSAHSPSFAPTVVNQNPPGGPAPAGMVWIPGGEFSMGSEDTGQIMCDGHDTMPDARPIHRVYVDGFWMDETEVTNEQFEKFVSATHYITIAEQTPNAAEFPGVPPENLVPGSLLFTPTSGPVPLNDYRRWWRYEKGANWRHPEGPDSNLKGRERYPVVHIAYQDALQYAKWAGKRLATEAEWEFAARGGSSGKLYPWGDDFRPDTKWMANTFQGRFPMQDTGEDGFAGSAPVKSFPPNAYGLYDVAGNVWEWCSDWYRGDYYRQLVAQSGVARNPTGPTSSFDPAAPMEKKRVQRGGSFLCTDQYCARYMVGTRGKGEVNTSSNHVGFRCVRAVTGERSD